MHRASFEARSAPALLTLYALLALSMIACSFGSTSASATQRLSQFGHSAWRTQDGLFASPNSIAQTSDGYIWIGTDRGLARFDGVRFVPSDALTGLPGSERVITALLGAGDGGLWIGAPGVVSHVKGGATVQYPVKGMPAQIVEHSDTGVWVVQTRAVGTPICHLAEGKSECPGPATVPIKYLSNVSRAADGGLWLGGSSALCHWYPGQAPAECYLQKKLGFFDGLDGISAISSAADGTVWVGIGRSGPDFGLGRLVDGSWQPFLADGLDGSKLAVSSIMQARDGALWIGTYDEGVYRIHEGHVDRYRSEDGLSSNGVVQKGIYEDREGIVWVLTSAGIDAFRQQPITVFSVREGLGSDGVESVLATRNGDVWLGNTTLSMLRNDQPVPPDHPELFGEKAVTSMLEDRDGRIWIGLDNTLQIYEQGTLTPVPRRDGRVFGIVTSLVEDTQGDIWAGTVESDYILARIRGGKVVEEMSGEKFGVPLTLSSDPTGGIWLGYRDGRLAFYKDTRLTFFPSDSASNSPIRRILVDPDRILWVCSRAGLTIQEGSERQLLDAAHGLPCQNIYEAIKDRNNALWMNAACGLIRIEAAELDRWRSDPTTRIRSQLFDTTDGAKSGNPSFSPGASVGQDGRLWFATTKFAQVVDPSVGVSTPDPPRVEIEELIVDRKAFATSAHVKLPPESRDISVRYTALSFRAPQKVRFRYQLEGRDLNLQDVGTRREAFYTDLPPGAYTFRVSASIGEESWSDSNATLSFEIPPLFYQTRWFLAVCALAAFLIAYGIFLVRLRQVAARLRQQMRVKSLERERIARELHDTLLQDTQALVLSFQTVAERIPVGDPARQMMERTLDKADQILAEGRECVLELRDPEATPMDLPEALSLVGDELAKSGACAFGTIVEGHARRLTTRVRDEAYRIGREGLINAFQHAQAENIELQITYGPNALVVQIRDDGKGIDPATLETGRKAGHWGLVGMRERARVVGGKLDIWSGSRPGTEIQFEVPAEIAYWSTDPDPVSWLSQLRTRRRPRAH